MAPAALQRAVFIAVLAFLFFLGMMVLYYVREWLGYFLLSTAFLLVYIVMMISFVLQRRRVIELYEGGLKIKDRPIYWDDIRSLSPEGTLKLKRGRSVAIASALNDRDRLIDAIRRNVV